jgi:hypothetical protein
MSQSTRPSPLTLPDPAPIPGIVSAGLLTEPVGVDQLGRANCDPVQRVKEIETREFLDRVREPADADAELANTARLLEHHALDAAACRLNAVASPPSPHR